MRPATCQTIPARSSFSEYKQRAGYTLRKATERREREREEERERREPEASIMSLLIFTVPLLFLTSVPSFFRLFTAISLFYTIHRHIKRLFLSLSLLSSRFLLLECRFSTRAPALSTFLPFLACSFARLPASTSPYLLRPSYCVARFLFSFLSFCRIRPLGSFFALSEREPSARS